MPDSASKFVLEVWALVAELEKKFDALSEEDKKKVAAEFLKKALAKVGEL
jgi:hypothetical protein